MDNDMSQSSTEFTPGFGVGKFGSNYCTFAKPDPELVVSDLIEGTSVAVIELKGIGKSSLLAESRERLYSIGRNVIWVDLATNNSPTKALSAILGSMQQGKLKGLVTSIKDWVKNSDFFPAEIKTTIGTIISGVIGDPWENNNQIYVDALFHQTGQLLESLDSDRKPIIIFDDLTTLITNTIHQTNPDETRKVVGKLNSFLGLLRSWRNDEIGIRMAVSGSVSFDWLHRKYGVRSDSINDCVRVHIKEMDREGARKLLELCLDSKSPTNWNEQLTEELLNFIPAYYPGVVQLAYNALLKENINDGTLTQSIRQNIQDAMWDQYYKQFETRFQQYGESEQVRIIKFVDALALQEDGKINAEKALQILDTKSAEESTSSGRQIIYNLISDSFIGIPLDGYRFTSGLVSAWRNTQPRFGNLSSLSRN